MNKRIYYKYGKVFKDAFGWGYEHYPSDNGASGFDKKEQAIQACFDHHKEWLQQLKEGLKETKALIKKWGIK